MIHSNGPLTLLDPELAVFAPQKKLQQENWVLIGPRFLIGSAEEIAFTSRGGDPET
jgi:hypothetical protein